MKFLSKLGQILLRTTEIVTGFAPIASMAYPQYAGQLTKVTDILNDISQIVVNVEAFGQVLGTAGPDKLKAATPLVAQIILRSDLLSGKKIDNAILFQQGVTKMTDGMADILNSLDDNISTEKKTN